MPVLCILKYQTKNLDEASHVMEVALGLGWDPSDEEPLKTREPAVIQNGREVVSVSPWEVHPAAVERAFGSHDAAYEARAVLDGAIEARIGYKLRASMLFGPLQ